MDIVLNSEHQLVESQFDSLRNSQSSSYDKNIDPSLIANSGDFESHYRPSASYNSDNEPLTLPHITESGDLEIDPGLIAPTSVQASHTSSQTSISNVYTPPTAFTCTNIYVNNNMTNSTTSPNNSPDMGYNSPYYASLTPDFPHTLCRLDISGTMPYGPIFPQQQSYIEPAPFSDGASRTTQQLYGESSSSTNGNSYTTSDVSNKPMPPPHQDNFNSIYPAVEDFAIWSTINPYQALSSGSCSPSVDSYPLPTTSLYTPTKIQTPASTSSAPLPPTPPTPSAYPVSPHHQQLYHNNIFFTTPYTHSPYGPPVDATEKQAQWQVVYEYVHMFHPRHRNGPTNVAKYRNSNNHVAVGVSTPTISTSVEAKGKRKRKRAGTAVSPPSVPLPVVSNPAAEQEMNGEKRNRDLEEGEIERVVEGEWGTAGSRLVKKVKTRGVRRTL
ncbi:hypothetical protein BGZ60DRAFT_529432 [Tricladium varicosporioides]|nr:hypothetical protein BGZ60DRAFT_529432 [Hymenoscyphus varicosporioides]